MSNPSLADFLRDAANEGCLADCDPRHGGAFASACSLVEAIGRSRSLRLAVALASHLGSQDLLLSLGERFDPWVERSVAGEVVLAMPLSWGRNGNAAPREFGLCRGGSGLHFGSEAIVAFDCEEADYVLLPLRRDDGPRALDPHAPIGEGQPAEIELAQVRGRTLIAYALTGTAEAALRSSLDFAVSRPLKSGFLADQGAVRDRFADMLSRHRIAAAFLAETVTGLGGAEATALTRATMAQIVSLGAATECIDGCLQLLGGRGFLLETRLARDYEALMSLVALLPAIDLELDLASRIDARS
jgi:hypothetical protein